jgi:sec-independent protein translocase protein TatC
MPLDQEFNIDDDYSGDKEMSFIDHLEELRWHIIRAVGAIAVGMILGFIFLDTIYQKIIMGPSRPDFVTYRFMCQLAEWVNQPDLCVNSLDFSLQNTEVSGQFTMALMSVLIMGLLVAFPYAFWEVWRFVKPGLKPAEQKSARFAVFWVSLLFFCGVSFGYFVVSPLAINFLANFKLDPSIKNQFTIESYISILATLTLACGLAFQLPVVIYILSKLGIVTPAFMRSYRRHAYVVILIISGFITPSPDIASQLLVTMPLIMLYEISIGVSARIQKSRAQDF